MKNSEGKTKIDGGTKPQIARPKLTYAPPLDIQHSLNIIEGETQSNDFSGRSMLWILYYAQPWGFEHFKFQK